MGTWLQFWLFRIQVESGDSMRRTPGGVFISLNDLHVLSEAVELAIENVTMDIACNHRPNSSFHDAAYKQWERAIKDSLRTYQKLARELAKMAKLKR